MKTAKWTGRTLALMAVCLVIGGTWPADADGFAFQRCFQSRHDIFRAVQIFQRLIFVRAPDFFAVHRQHIGHADDDAISDFVYCHLLDFLSIPASRAKTGAL